MSCKEFVELVTDYLEDALPPADRQEFERHLALCPGCVTYLDQIRETMAIVGAVHEESISPEAREELLHVFRDWKRR